MTQRGIKKKAEEEEENEKEEERYPFSCDEFREMFNSDNIPDEVDGVFTGSIDLSQLDEDTESNNSSDLKKPS
ncbi:hypothetical protein F2Q68_00041628 [Brassica cretica]|nr:hypothetical protein F2Q68_00041628 [Brassica cretica]